MRVIALRIVGNFVTEATETVASGWVTTVADAIVVVTGACSTTGASAAQVTAGAGAPYSTAREERRIGALGCFCLACKTISFFLYNRGHVLLGPICT